MTIPPYPPHLTAGEENRLNSLSSRLTRIKDQAGEIVGRAYEYNVSGSVTGSEEDYSGISVSGRGSFASSATSSASVTSRPRPRSRQYFSQRGAWDRKRCCGNLTRLEMCLFTACLVLLGGLLSTLAAWFVISKGFILFGSGELGGFQGNTAPTTLRPVTLNATVPANPYAEDTPICGTAGCGRIAGYFLSNAKHSVDPCDDFYEFVCGNFPIYNHKLLPNEMARNTISLTADALLEQMRELLSADVENEEPHWRALVKTFYQRCVDQDSIDETGAADLASAMEDVGGWPALEGDAWDLRWANSTEGYKWETVLGEVARRFGVDDVILELMIGADEKNVNRSVIILDQQNLGMQSIALYADGPDSAHAANYTKQMVDVAAALGANGSDVARQMRQVTIFEGELAGIMSPNENRRGSAERMYNLKELGELEEQYPEIDLFTFVSTAFPDVVQIQKDELLVVRELSYYRALQKVMREADPRTIQNYIVWRVLLHFAMFTPRAAQKPQYEFKAFLTGIRNEPPIPRWVECVTYTTRVLPMPTGAIYVEKHFGGQPVLDKMTDMAEQLRYAFINELKDVEWMDDLTKAAALEKAYKLSYRIAYPPYYNNATFMEGYWIDTNLDKDSSALLAAMQLKVLLWVEDSSKLRDPVDTQWWYQSPAQVEAYYAPSLHQMIFPAGIMRFPFLRPDVPNYVTYAMAGAIIGHEISHGFDDQGAQYDKNGQLHDWWDRKTKENFKKKTQCIERQYSAVHIREAEMNIDGKNSLGENIADNAGIKTAYNAYKLWEERQFYEEPAIPGFQNFTNDQMFFISYVNNWCSVTRPESARAMLMSDPHAPAKYRALIPLRNFPRFAETFDCPAGSPMNPMTKCKVW